MARGAEAKNSIWDKMLEVYPDAFWEDTGKILRIPMIENGERIEVKVTLTAAKNNLGEAELKSAFDAAVSTSTVTENSILEPTEEEKANVNKLLASLGM